MKRIAIILLLVFLISCSPKKDILNNVTIEEYSFSNFKILDTNINILVCIDETKEKSLITKESMELTLNEVNDYFKKTTYDKINLNFIFAGENSADKDSINNYNHKAESISNELFEREKEAIKKCDKNTDFNNIDNVIIYPVGNNGLSNGLPEREIITEEGKFKLGITYISAEHFNKGIIQHELGHSLFGLPHSSSLSCGSTIFKQKECIHEEYGNSYDVMGSGFNNDFNAWFKFNTKLINHLRITKDGKYSLSKLEDNTEDIKLLRIPYKDNPLCFDYKTISNFDNSEEECLLMSLCPASQENIARLSSHSLLYTKKELGKTVFNNACIKENEIFENEELGIIGSYIKDNNKINLNLDINDNNLETLPDIDFSIENYDTCNLNGNIALNIWNNNEYLLENEIFDVELYGISNNKKELLFRENVEINRPNQRTKINYNNIQQFDKLIGIVDSTKLIEETDENNIKEVVKSEKC